MESTDAEALDLEGRLDWRSPQLQQDHSDDQESDVCDARHRPGNEYRERCRDSCDKDGPMTDRIVSLICPLLLG